MSPQNNDKKIGKYLVTGGLGFLGRALVRRLLKEGREVRILDNEFRGSTRSVSDILDRVEFVRGDIRDAETVKKACEGITTVCHLASINGTKFFYSQPQAVLEVGIKGMMNVIDACIAHGIKDLVVASSSEVYQQPQTVPTDESTALVVPDPLNPRYSYGGQKIACELLALNYGKFFFDRVTIFRPHNVYGPDMGWEHVIPEFSLRMLELPKNNSQFEIQGDGSDTRSFIYIDDFIDGLMLVIDRGEHLNIYHIGTMDEVPITEVADGVAKVFGRHIEIKKGERAWGATTRRCPEIGKLKRLGFSPRVSLAEGLEQTVSWYRDHSHLRPKHS